jgi:uncharacterized protein (TIGR00730 family)
VTGSDADRSAAGTPHPRHRRGNATATGRPGSAAGDRTSPRTADHPDPATAGHPDPTAVGQDPASAGHPDPASIEAIAEAMVALLPGDDHRDLYRGIVRSVVGLAAEGTETLDLKIARAALGEMADAFRVFRPYRGFRKVTFFGSARTSPDDPAYHQARRLAARLADAGWMVVTGAGPGIMAAGMEGAGRARSLGVNIRLPFEQGANRFIDQDPKLVEMRYFFTRKLMLIKESDGYAVLPGGFGTLDEAFELLTLLQTGKAQPAPIVLLDVPDSRYWAEWERFVDEQVAARGLVDPEDRTLYRITAGVDEAVEEILGFYRNYHSMRWVGDLLVVRVRQVPSRSQLAELNDRFADMVRGGGIRTTKPLPPERSDDDHLDLPRLALRFDRAHHGRLRQFIDALNALR